MANQRVFQQQRVASGGAEARQIASDARRVNENGQVEPSIGETFLAGRLQRLVVDLEKRGRPPLAAVYFDTVRASMSGSEDNSDNTSAYQRAVRRIMAPVPSAAAVLLHHAGWQDGEAKRKRERGSSAWRGNADATLYLEAPALDVLPRRGARGRGAARNTGEATAMRAARVGGVPRRSVPDSRSAEREELVLAALDARDRAALVMLERERPGRLRLAACIVRCYCGSRKGLDIETQLHPGDEESAAL